MNHEDIVTICQNLVGPTYPLTWEQGRVVSKASLHWPAAAYFPRFLDAFNTAVGMLQAEDFPQGVTAQHYMKATLPDVAVSILLTGQDHVADLQDFLDAMKQVSSFTYENKRAEVGFLLTTGLTVAEIRTILATRSLSFVEFSGQQLNVDFLRSSKQAYVLADGRSIAYVVDGRGTILGLAKKQANTHEIRDQVMSDAERQTDRWLIRYWLQEAIAEQFAHNDETLIQYPAIFQEVLQATLRAHEWSNRITNQITEGWPPMIYGYVHDGRFRCELGPRTYVQWAGGTWRFHDGIVLESQIAVELLAKELKYGNNIPSMQLAADIASPSAMFTEVLSHMDNPEQVILLMRAVQSMLEEFEHLTLQPDFQKFWSTFTQSLFPSLDWDTVPDAFKGALEKMVAIYHESQPATGSTLSPSFDLETLLAVSESLADRVLDLSHAHIGALLIVAQSQATQSIIDDTAQHAQDTFLLHKTFLAPADGHAPMDVRDMDKYFFRRLCQIDGATLLTSHGTVVDFGLMAKIPENAKGPGEGARTLAAKNFSILDGVLFVLKVSEDGPVSFFNNGTNRFDIY